MNLQEKLWFIFITLDPILSSNDPVIPGVSKKMQPLNILRYSYCSSAQNILGPWEFKMASNRAIEQLLIVISAELIMVQLTTEQRIYCA